MTEIDTCGTTEEDCAATTDEWDRIFIKIARTPATTPAGVRAKAAVVSTAVCRESCDSGDYLTNPKSMDCGRLDGVLARSLCADILATGGAA
jgi:hypothetical protein